MDTSFNTSVISFQYKLLASFRMKKELNSIQSYMHTIFVCVCCGPSAAGTDSTRTYSRSVGVLLIKSSAAGYRNAWKRATE